MNVMIFVRANVYEFALLSKRVVVKSQSGAFYADKLTPIFPYPLNLCVHLIWMVVFIFVLLLAFNECFVGLNIFGSRIGTQNIRLYGHTCEKGFYSAKQQICTR